MKETNYEPIDNFDIHDTCFEPGMRWGLIEADAGGDAFMDVVPNNEQAAVISQPSPVPIIFYMWNFEKIWTSAVTSCSTSRDASATLNSSISCLD
jgi:hypothetical protein